ncbi:Ppx/GppA family phosphatase, partial [Candidatus Auribacterota bacterium]
LDRSERDVVLKLSGILRIADGLDRAHCESVKDIEIVGKGNKLFFKLRSNKILPEDIYGANKKKDLFEKVFRKRVIIDIPA